MVFSHFEYPLEILQTNVIMMFAILLCFRGVGINLDSLMFVQKGHRGQKGSRYVRLCVCNRSFFVNILTALG